MDLNLDDIERDIKPEDFAEGTVQRDILEAIAEHGRMAGPHVLKIIWIHTHQRTTTKKLSWPSWSFFTRKATDRSIQRTADSMIRPGPHE